MSFIYNVRLITFFSVALLQADGLMAQDDRALSKNMTLDELRECAEIAWTMDDIDKKAALENRILAARGQAIRTESDAIDRLRRTLNLRDGKAVAAFNARLKRNQGAVAAFNADSRKAMGNATAYQASQQTYAVKCVSRPYDPKLKDSLPLALKVAMEKHSSISTVYSIPAAEGDAPQPLPFVDAAGHLITAGPKPSTDPLAAVRVLADKGDAKAQYGLGVIYYEGQGVARDRAKAFEWFVKAAAGGNADAAFAASDMIFEGVDVPSDEKRARQFVVQAAEGGNASAQRNLATLLVRDDRPRDHLVQAFGWLAKAAAQGNSAHQFELAQFYRDGIGTRKDQAASLDWLRKSAAQGFRPAQLALGYIYRKGEGIARDPVEALKWFRLAAGLTKVDAKAKCSRLLQVSATRQEAEGAVKQLSAELSAFDVDRAIAAADDFQLAAKTQLDSGC